MFEKVYPLSNLQVCNKGEFSFDKHNLNLNYQKSEFIEN